MLAVGDWSPLTSPGYLPWQQGWGVCRPVFLGQLLHAQSRTKPRQHPPPAPTGLWGQQSGAVGSRGGTSWRKAIELMQSGLETGRLDMPRHRMQPGKGLVVRGDGSRRAAGL